jgi:hypothetical protein
MMQGALSKERRETKIASQRERDQTDQHRVVGEHMLDPMAKGNTEKYAMPSERQGRQEDMPEWKRHVTGTQLTASC